MADESTPSTRETPSAVPSNIPDRGDGKIGTNSMPRFENPPPPPPPPPTTKD